MNRVKPTSSQVAPNRFFAALVAVLAVWLLSGACTVAAPSPWWDCLPRYLSCNSVQAAVDYHANMVMCGAGTDPGWGPWFTWGSNSSIGGNISQRQAFDAVGIHSLSYTEGFGTVGSIIVGVGTGSPLPIEYTHWSWPWYNGTDPVYWSGAWTWFDDAQYARPYTRTGPTCPGSPMTYPDGTVATGFVNNDSSDPRNSKVYDAGCSGDIMGNVQYWYDYNDACNAPGGITTGLLYVPATGKYASSVSHSKDASCPMWADYAHALTYFAAQQVGGQGTWCDNWSPWDSFCCGPVRYAFGKWSVAGFRTYLQNNFTVSQLISMGVLTSGQTYANLSSFDIRTYLKTKASSSYGWDGSNLDSGAWSNSGWINDSVWTAYKIWRRQSGTTALANLYNGVKSGGALGGQPDYLVQGNDIAPAMLGWLRGTLDMASTELSLGWNLSAGSRGINLPPFGRVAPFYKAAREMAKSRFVNVWLYNDGFVDQSALTPVVNALYYEMLATHTTQKPAPEDNPVHMVGNPTADKAFFQFVADKVSPEIGARTPIEDVGIYCSTSSILSQWTPGGVLTFDSQPHHFAIWGWATALDELHYQYRIIPEWKLTAETLAQLKVLIIPHSEVFTSSDAAILDSWVRNSGGVLIVTGNSGARQGESGNLATYSSLSLGSLTGVTNWSSAPTTKSVTVGSGRVRFIKSNYGLTYWGDTATQRASFLPTIASEVSTQLSSAGKHVVLTSNDTPSTTGLTLYEDTRAKKLFLDVNNVNITIAADNKSASVTPTPTIHVTVYKPSWWNTYGDRGLVAYAFSPDGPVALPTPSVSSDHIDLTIPPTNYYTCVVMTPAIGMGTAKSVADGDSVVLNSQIISAVYSDSFYIEDTNRTIGMRVGWTSDPVKVGDAVSVAGNMGTTPDGERTIIATDVESYDSYGGENITPLAMNCRSIGGADLKINGNVSQKGVDQGQGPNNVGLLVKVSGNVSGDGTGYFCVDDGSMVTDASGSPGVRVLCDGLSNPGTDTFVTVTGVSTLKTIGGVTYRCIRASDIQMISKATLIGKWDFEGTNPLDNKAPGVTWDPMSVSGGAATSGKLLLRRYSSGGWKQGRATAMLKTDLGPAGYFKEMTQVAWVYWPNFTSTCNGRIIGIFKFNSSTYDPANTLAGQAIAYGDSSGRKWMGYNGWEFLNSGSVQSASQFIDLAPTSDPPTTGYIKIAQVLKKVDADNYQLKMYWDIGSGLVQTGSTVTIPASQVSSFGQYNTNCLVDASGGKRYDGVGLMDLTTAMPASMGSIYFDEVRLYAGALSQYEINMMTPGGP